MERIKMKSLLNEDFIEKKTTNIISNGDTVVSLTSIKGHNKAGREGVFTKGHKFKVKSVDDQYNTLSGYNLIDSEGGFAYATPKQVKLAKGQ